MKRAGWFFACCALASCAPFFPRHSERAALAPTTDGFPGWKHLPLNAAALAPVALTERDAKFARDFPGRIGAFTDQYGVTYIVRWVAQPTRQLHPASDCLRALGYTLRPGPIFVDADGTRWSSTRATREGARLCVRERICDDHGCAWTDVSAWYWSAAFGQTRGPWWAVTVLEPASE